MIFELLKQLPPAMGRFLAYHSRRALGKVQHSPQPQPHLQQDSDELALPAASSPLIPAPSQLHASGPSIRLRLGLAPRYLELVDWPTYQVKDELPELLADPLFKRWMTIPNGHKWSQYFATYRKVFEARRDEPLRILEIGVYRGSGLRLWREYFSHPQTTITGIDIQVDCSQFAMPAKGIEVRIGSQTDQAFLDAVVSEFGPFDIIIDDGSHHTAHQIESFNHLFATGLKAGGIYLVEDLHAGYWPDWRDSENSFLDTCKELIELMHVHYQRDDLPRTFARHVPDQHESIKVPAITRMLGEIRLFDSIAVIEKAEREFVPYYVTTELPPAGSAADQ